MTTVVRRHFPVSKLPPELREGFSETANVRVQLEEEPQPERVLTLEEILAMRRPVFKNGEEADAYVRAMRDEWE